MANYLPLTESASPYNNLGELPLAELLEDINREDSSVPLAVGKAIPAIEKLVAAIAAKMKEGGRLFYMGAGTSGRLGMVDASECPPTFGVDAGKVTGIIAGGKEAMFKAVEFAEDDTEAGWKDLQAHGISANDFVTGISASGTTPYVLGALEACRKNGIATGSICNNPGSPISELADYPVEVITGPEFLTGSTRMKSGTAQKLVLNMISTSVMIRLGLVEGNRMVNMQLTNQKLLRRGTKMVMEATGLSQDAAGQLLVKEGSVKKAVENWKRSKE